MAQGERKPTCKPTGFCQEEGAPGHQEEQRRLQQGEAVQLGKLGHVSPCQGTHLQEQVPESPRTTVYEPRSLFLRAILSPSTLLLGSQRGCLLFKGIQIKLSSRIEVTKGWERGRILFNEDTVSVGNDEKVLEVDSGDSYTTLWLYLMSLKCTLKILIRANFILYTFYHN